MANVSTEVLVNDIINILSLDEWVYDAEIYSNGHAASLRIKKETKKLVYNGTHSQMVTALIAVATHDNIEVAEQAKCFLEDIG